MISLNFSTALVVFTVVLSIIFTVLLILSNNGTKRNAQITLLRRKGNTLLNIIFVLAIITLFLTLSTNIRLAYPPLYYGMITIITSVLVITITLSGDKKPYMALSVIILLHLIMLYAQLPASGISIGEGAEMYRGMYITGRWNFSFAHNPAYNPFPAAVYITVALAKVINVKWYSAVAGNIYYVIFIAGYDLVMYVITYEITRSKTAALIATLLVNVTPETALTTNPHMWLSNMLALLSLYAFIKYLDMKMKNSYMITAALAYTTAMLALTTATLAIIVPLSLMLIEYVIRPPLKRIINMKPLPGIALNGANPYNMERLRAETLYLTILIAITLLIAVYTEGYLSYVSIPLNGFINNLINFFTTHVLPKPSSPTALPLYNRAGVSPIQALPWSLAPALATGLVLAQIIKRRVSTWYVGIYLTAAILLLIGYLSRTVFIGGATLSTSLFVAIPLLLPLSGIAYASITNDLSTKRNKIIAILLLILLVAVIPIAAHDPNVSPIEYAKIHHTPITNPPKYTYDLALSIVDLLPNQGTNTLIVYSEPTLQSLGYAAGIGNYPIFTNIPSGVIGTALYIMNITNTNILIGANYTNYYAGYYINNPPYPTITYVPANLVFSANSPEPYDIKIFVES